MTIEVFWGSGSPYSWRVLLALEFKRLPYVSHLLQFSKQEHKSQEMLALTPRGGALLAFHADRGSLPRARALARARRAAARLRAHLSAALAHLTSSGDGRPY